MVLSLHSCGSIGTLGELDLSASALPNGIVWIDLLNPAPDESAFVERATGLRIPAVSELNEIENSSRLRTEGGVLYLSTPAVFRRDGQPVATPIGFVLGHHHLITIRYEALIAFESFGAALKGDHDIHASSSGVFAGLLEAIVDRIADVLEQVGSELDGVSHDVFHAKKAGGERSAREETTLRETLRGLGRKGDLVSKIRDSLMGIGRIVPYAMGRSVHWMPGEVKAELETLRLDIMSLNDYDAYLSTKIQFLLDATLGLINIEQNNIIKVLTVATVVGVPPTLVASWYGMNFKNIPEYDWSFGYPYAIALALITAVLPLVWFRVKGWF
jgi:magnesium transporter